MSETIVAPSIGDPNAGGEDYFRQSRRPLASLLFTLPLLAVYELGVVLQGESAILNGADVWLRQLLGLLGIASSLALPALIVGILLAWHHTTGEPWRVRSSVLGGMLVECAVLAGVLLGGVHLQHRVFEWLSVPLVGPGEPASAISAGVALVGSVQSVFAHLVSYFGAGVYEETLFRLILLPVVVLVLRAAKVRPRTAMVIAVVVTSALFSAAHHVGASGEPLDPFRMTFRFLAGVFFCLLFLLRGYGIAVGTHALYDVFAALS
jgi:hypothetical protein